jgi:tetratricopeptide (TPR) repeat protein
VAERLIERFRAGGQPLLAVDVAEQAYERLGAARWLLLAMDTAVQAKQPQALRRLLAVARRDQARFDDSVMYWLITAYAANEDLDRVAARQAYDRALAIEPASVSTRTQVLWFEIGGDDKVNLGRLLDAWQRDADTEPAFWMPYAVGLVKVGRSDESVAWYERQVQAAPGDIQWQLSYAYVLAQAGRPALAQGLRRGIYQRLRDNPGYLNTLTQSDKRVLMLAQASMAREVDGPDAALRVLRDMHAGGYRDAAVYSQLVAAALDLRDFDGAQHWLAMAQGEGHALPAYQVLGIAGGRNDRAALQSLLRERSQELSVTDHVVALRLAGRPSDALGLIDSHLVQAPAAVVLQLRQLRSAIEREQARFVDVRFENRNIGELDIRQRAITASQPTQWGRSTVRLASHALRSEPSSTNIAIAGDETDLSLVADLNAAGDPLRLILGTNLRSHASFAYGGAVWSHGLGGGARVRLEALVNALTEESAAMRALGRKHRLSVGLSVQPSPSTYARLEMAAQRFQTREGDALGRGFRLEGEWGAVLRQGSPIWQVRLSGSTDRNQLEGSLPSSLVGTSLSPFSTVESLLSRRFSTLGVGSTLRVGQADGADRAPHGFVDVWAGRQWPANELAYSLRVGAGVPVRATGSVKLEAHYINVQNGVTGSGKSSQGISLGYRHGF